MVIRNATRDVELVAQPRFAASPWSRFMGLMGRAGLQADEGLVLEPANSIHMFFMRFPIDAVFVDRDWKVLHVAHEIAPWRVTRMVRHSRRVIELPAGRCRATGTIPGDLLSLV